MIRIVALSLVCSLSSLSALLAQEAPPTDPAPAVSRDVVAPIPADPTESARVDWMEERVSVVTVY